MVDMESDEEILRELAVCGTMDYSTWPLLLNSIVSRIEKIAREDFPIPRIPQPTAAPPPPPPPEPRFLAPLPSSDPTDPPSTSIGTASSTSSSQENNKENAAPASTPPTSAPAPAPPAPSPAPLEPGTLPPQILSMLAEITGVLKESFHTYPPHTIQRLAELVLSPRRHYKSLPAYLHALDRVVHVTSGNNIYPLPPAIPDMSSMLLGPGGTNPNGSNGVVTPDDQDNGGRGGEASVWASSNGGPAIGSDEALGGALLTPIPWLQRHTPASGGDGSAPGSESGESSTMGSDGGTATQAPNQGSVSASQQRSGSQAGAGRQFERQIHTENTETIDGPNGMGSIETVSISINGIPPISAGQQQQQQRVITQGELIRQEQRAGVVPVSQLSRSGPIVVTASTASTSTSTPLVAGTAPVDDATTDTAMVVDEAKGAGESSSRASKENSSERSDQGMADDEEAPHARGPDIIGAADMGPQTPTSSTFSISSSGNVEVRGIDVEAAVGRKAEAQPTAAPAETGGDGLVLTPASSESEKVKDAGESESGKARESNGEEVREKEKIDDKEESSEAQTGVTPLSDAMSTEPQSTSLSARSSPAPGKREAEDDLSDTGSISAKRQKGPPEKDETASEGAPVEGSVAKESEKSEPKAAEEEKPSDEQVNKDGDGDIALVDHLADASTSVASARDAGTGTEIGTKKGGDDQAQPAESMT